MSTNKTESIRFFWNGIKVNGGKLIRCFYFTDSESVTISARDYADLPRDMFKVKNETDLYTDYFDSDSATLTPAHPLYKYARAAALKSAMRGEPEYIAKLEQDEQDAKQPGRYHWRKPEDIRAEIDRRQAQLDRNAAELATLPKGHPTAADVEAVHEMNTAAESARLAREHAEQLERREKAIRTRNENRAFIEQTAAAHPIKDGAPVVTVEWSENGAFDDGMKFSVAAAEIIFKTLDEKISAEQERGYDKTSFSITYTDADGEPSTYEGRYDLGDNDGGLIAHIRSFGAFLRDKGNFGNGKPTDEDKETGAAIVAVADLLEQYTEGGRVVSVMPAPWLEEYKRRKAEQAQQEQEQARQDFADILESVQMLTDEQIERAVFAISPTDAEKLDVAASSFRNCTAATRQTPWRCSAAGSAAKIPNSPTKKIHIPNTNSPPRRSRGQKGKHHGTDRSRQENASGVGPHGMRLPPDRRGVQEEQNEIHAGQQADYPREGRFFAGSTSVSGRYRSQRLSLHSRTIYPQRTGCVF